MRVGDCCPDLGSFCSKMDLITTIGNGTDVRIHNDTRVFNTERLGLLIEPATFALDFRSRVTSSINGPSLIKVPSFVKEPLGKYYLYFSHHRDTYMRMAYADNITGPYTIYAPGVMDVADVAGGDHVASPDVFVDEETQQIRMYYHAWATDDNHTQLTFVAFSSTGLDFFALPHQLGRPYFRVFKYNDWYYALSKDYSRGGMFQRSPVADGFSQEFEYGTSCIDRKRHSAVWVQGDYLYIFYSRVRDAPEAIFITRVSLEGNWTNWQSCAHGHLLLRPEMDYEGADLPIRTSRAGTGQEPVHELRDPGIYEEAGRVYVLYSVAGESGIAMAELKWKEESDVV